MKKGGEKVLLISTSPPKLKGLIEMIIDNVVVEADETVFSKDELKKYVDYAKTNCDGTLKKIRVKLSSDGKVDIDFKTSVPFERVRRITGYLTGDLTTWNDAKRAEESERVKHGVGDYGI